MAFFTARILSMDSVVVAENVPVWITCFHMKNAPRWDGSLTVPTTTGFMEDTYRLQLDDGRQGTITQINVWITEESLTVYYEGKEPLQRDTR